MYPTRYLLLVAFAILVAISAGCRDRRPVWSIDGTAIEELELGEDLRVSDELPIEWPDPGCQMVISAKADRDLPELESETEEWRAWLGAATETEVGCDGRCADGSRCLLHYNVALLNNESARTRCACTPQDTPPCALTIEWGLGKRTRRAIRRIWCESGGEATQRCEPLFVPGSEGLQLTCTSAG